MSGWRSGQRDRLAGRLRQQARSGVRRRSAGERPPAGRWRSDGRDRVGCRGDELRAGHGGRRRRCQDLQRQKLADGAVIVGSVGGRVVVVVRRVRRVRSRCGVMFRVRGVALVRVAATVPVAVVRICVGRSGVRRSGVGMIVVGVVVVSMVMEDHGTRHSQQIAGQRDAGNQDSTTRTHRDTHPAGGCGTLSFWQDGAGNQARGSAVRRFHDF